MAVGAYVLEAYVVVLPGEILGPLPADHRRQQTFASALPPHSPRPHRESTALPIAAGGDHGVRSNDGDQTPWSQPMTRSTTDPGRKPHSGCRVERLRAQAGPLAPHA